VAEPKRAFGERYDSPEEMNRPDKVSARKTYGVLTAAALGLVLFSALVPVLALPTPDNVVRFGSDIDQVTFLDAKGDRRLNPSKLNAVLSTMRTDIDSIAVLDPGERLIVSNCGMAHTCKCPQPYRAVPDSGGWNLNDRTTGAVIRLCSRRKQP